MASSVFSLRSSTSSRDAPPKKYPSNSAACENCHSRKQRCVPGHGSCQACSALGIECKPREHHRLGRPRGTRQSEWRAEVNNSKSYGRRNSHRSDTHSAPSSATVPQIGSPDFTGALLALEDVDSATTQMHLSPSTSNSNSSIDTFPWDACFGMNGTFDAYQSSLSAEDLELHDLHYKIRNALSTHRSADPMVPSRHPQSQAGIGTLEELSETLHKMPWTRPMLLFGVAVLWDALELSVHLSADLINHLDNSEQTRLTGSTFSGGYVQQPGLSMDQDALALSTLVSSMAPTTRNRQGADIVRLTRLGVCLGDFSTFAKNFEEYGGDSAAPAQRTISDCRRRIAALHESITQRIHMVTCTWSGGSKEH